jgi:hypothetical protein
MLMPHDPRRLTLFDAPQCPRQLHVFDSADQILCEVINANKDIAVFRYPHPRMSGVEITFDEHGIRCDVRLCLSQDSPYDQNTRRCNSKYD